LHKLVIVDGHEPSQLLNSWAR